MKLLTYWISLVAAAAIVTNLTAAELKGHCGATFELLPTAIPGQLADAVKGLAQFKGLKNWSFEANQTLQLSENPEEPMIVRGVWRFTSADGNSTILAENEGQGVPDPENPSFVNLRYRLTFISGTGMMRNVRGEAKLKGVAMLATPTSGTATFVVKGEFVAFQGPKEGK